MVQASESSAGILIGTSLREAACRVLSTSDTGRKISLTAEVARAWRSGEIGGIGECEPPLRPGRPERPPLLLPRDMPKRSGAGLQGRIALLHALAHIELNAIDLAWDLIARFGDPTLPRAFFDDWVKVADDEALHFRLLSERLAILGSSYGDLPAHDGLWQSAEATAGDVLARLAVVPLVLEARGLDVTPATVERLERHGDLDSAAILRRIYDDEITHVASGRRWFDWFCVREGLPVVETYHAKVRRFFRGKVKPPFNEAGRDQAGLSPAFYAPLALDED